MKTEINCANNTVTVTCGGAPCDQNTVIEVPRPRRAYQTVTDQVVAGWVTSWRNGSNFYGIAQSTGRSAPVIAFNVYKWLFHEQAIRIADLEEQLRIVRLENKKLREKKAKK